MTKDWFLFGKSRRRVTAGPRPGLIQEEVALDRGVTTDLAAESISQRDETRDAASPEALAPGEATRSAVALIETREAPQGGDAGGSSVEPLTVGIPSPVESLARRLSGAPLPSYVDTQTASVWLAALAGISAVTAYKALSYDLLDLKP